MNPAELPIESFDDLPVDAQCMICFQPSLDNVSMCGEGHNACRTCANAHWRNTLFSDTSKQCPKCRSPLIKPDGQWMRNTALNNLVAEFQVKCPHAQYGCPFKAKMPQVKAHIDVECGTCKYEPMKCKVISCDWQGAKCKWHDHLKEVDHGRHLVDAILFTQEGTAAAEKQVASLTVALGGVQDQMSIILNKTLLSWGGVHEELNAKLASIDRTLKDHIGGGWPSDRTTRRDKKTVKDVEEATRTAFTACQDRDQAQRKLLEVEKQVIELTGEKRKRKEQTEDTMRMLFARNKQLHDMHQAMAALVPQMAPARCPCDPCQGRSVRSMVTGVPTPTPAPQAPTQEELLADQVRVAAGGGAAASSADGAAASSADGAADDAPSDGDGSDSDFSNFY